MTADQAQTIIDALMMIGGLLGSVIVACTWKG